MLLPILLVLAAAPATQDKPKLAVLELVPGGVEAHVASALTEAITQEISGRGYFAVVSSREIKTLLGFERQKQMMGCAEASSCLAELAGAMGARFVLSGTISKLGDALQLSLQTLDTGKAQPLGRSVRIARSLDALIAQLPFAVADATATPLPPPPSRVLPYSLIGAGALVIVGGAVVGIDGVSRDLALIRELTPGSPVLRTLSDYRAEASTVSTEKTLGVVGFVAGAALIAAGILFNPPDVAAPTHVSLVPTAQGVALAGVWP